MKRLQSLLLAVGLVTAAALTTMAESTASTAAPLFERVDLARSGVGAHTYRIPALDVLPDGTLIASYDRRNNSSADLPGDIDIMVRRSYDQGRTWTDPQVVADYTDGVGAGDPSLLVDRRTGRIFLFYAYGPQGIGFFASGPGNANDSTSILHTDYSYSDDGGRTWIARRITADIKDPSWLGIFASSGTGIQLRTGRLLQQYAFRKADGSIWAVSAYSDDHGETWRSGTPVGPLMDENKTVELADGRVMLNSRTSSTKRRLVAYSRDGGISYSTPVPDDELIDPTNNAAILRYDAGARADRPEAHWLLFSNTASTTARERLTVRMSCNDGQGWPISRVVEPGPAAYSTLSRLADGTFGLLYESGPYQTITFARFDAAWLGADCPIDRGHPKLGTTPAAPVPLQAGRTGELQVRVTNHDYRDSLPAAVTLDLPAGWTAATRTRWIGALDGGARSTVRFAVTPPAGTTGEHQLGVRVRAGDTDSTSTASLLVLGGTPVLEAAPGDFDGVDDFTDLTGQLDVVAGLRTGAIAAVVRTGTPVGAGSILSASDTRAPSTNVTLSLNGGVPCFEARKDGGYLARLTAPRSVADGRDAVVAVVAGEAGTALYVDGVRVASSASAGFFGQVSGLTGMWAGRNVDDAGPQWHYAGRISRIAVHR